MGKLFVTGDTHGDFTRIKYLCEKFETTKEDAIIILGDAGINYWGGGRERNLKRMLEKLPITFLCLRGNHERRPSLDTYLEKWIDNDLYSGCFLVEPDYPSLLFMKDGEEYYLGSKKTHTIALGGAYSVDKYYRLEMQELGNQGYHWFCDEQLSEEEKSGIFDRLYAGWKDGKNLPSVVLSHTCPKKYTPTETFLPYIDQSTVDDSMEQWLDRMEEFLPYSLWMCGHWHINKPIDKVRFIFGDILLFDDVYNGKR